MKPLNYRLCYNEEKCRVQHVIRPGKLAASGALDIWAQHACARSHSAALECVVRSFTSKRKYILVLEDDIVLPKGISCAQFWSRLHEVIRYLNKNHQNWVALLLGAVPLLCEAGGNKQTGLANLHSARRAAQAHAIVWNNRKDTQACIATVQSKIAKGMVADNAMAAIMKVFQDSFYYLHPCMPREFVKRRMSTLWMAFLAFRKAALPNLSTYLHTGKAIRGIAFPPSPKQNKNKSEGTKLARFLFLFFESPSELDHSRSGVSMVCQRMGL